jgi:hypothetical protein
MASPRGDMDLWAARLSPLRQPAGDQPGLSEEDERAQRDISFRVRELLRYQAVLPPELAAMLMDYLPVLDDRASGRWKGAGHLVRPVHLADDIAYDITAGRWAAGERVHMDYFSVRYYMHGVSRDTLRRAMQLLAARGEVTVRHDGYYVRLQ